jgi:hypothetical protein
MKKRRSFTFIAALAILLVIAFGGTAIAQDGGESSPSSALAAALTAACRANDAQFSNYLTADNAAAFRALSQDQRASFMRRFSFADGAGKPLISSDTQNHTVFRCNAPEGTAEFRFGDTRTRENLAFVPITVVDGQQTEFGLVRENGGWRLLSLGLVLLDVPALSKEWSAADLTAREDATVTALRSLADAVQTYRNAYGKLPESLAQMGPAPKGEISPEQADLVDERVAAGREGGYRFQYRIVPDARGNDLAFEVVATPDDYGKTGRRSFLLDASGKVHGVDNHGQIATADDPLIAESP